MSDSTHHDHSSGTKRYTFWTWLIAIVLAIYLFWHWQHDTYQSSCCASDTSVVATSPFSFSASSVDGYASTGDISAVSWASKSQTLADWLKGGADWKVEGNATHVTLTGTVDSLAVKEAKGAEAQAFFGDTVTVDNQLTIKASEATAAISSAPDLAKIYFETAEFNLPADASQTLAPIVEWAKNNPKAKVVISGFHDPRGKKSKNKVLAKKRANQVFELLKNAGVAAENIELRKPQNVEAGGNLDEARRAEVFIE